MFLGGLGSFFWGSFLSRVDMGFGEDWDGDGRGDFFDGHFAFLFSSSSSLLSLLVAIFGCVGGVECVW